QRCYHRRCPACNRILECSAAVLVRCVEMAARRRQNSQPKTAALPRDDALRLRFPPKNIAARSKTDNPNCICMKYQFLLCLFLLTQAATASETINADICVF